MNFAKDQTYLTAAKSVTRGEVLGAGRLSVLPAKGGKWHLACPLSDMQQFSN